jgi:3-methyladenine DNA glycosylase/8-oxoguanine DNA glycosylase
MRPTQRNTGAEDALAPGDVGQFHAFPSLEQLRCATEQELRDNGFGYRARYIVDSVQMLNEMEGGAMLDCIVPLTCHCRAVDLQPCIACVCLM